ncbi:hypothetical protein JYT71_00590 [Acidimicrobiaceae bacterium AH-315-P05]|nr:hypothetical protein [Acidimicrobiaceae bacterium AH-315-P05]
MLRQRFENRVTVVIAGAGMGKSTSLAIAIHENKLAPAGIDIWVGCEPADLDEHHFLHGLSSALSSTVDLDVAGICEAVVGRAPQHVCLVLDDVHELGPNSHVVLDQLVDDLPANGHLLFSGRTEPQTPLARLEAQGLVGRLDPQQLLLRPEEVAEIHGPQAATHGGWPALISLGARHGRAGDFILQEVVGRLSNDEAAAINALVAIGPADVATLEAVVGSTESALALLPMVSHNRGLWIAHDLWADAIEDTSDHDRLRLKAIEHLQSTQNHHRIIEVALRSRALGTSLLASLNHLITTDPPTSLECRRWLESVGALADEPEFLFLEGLRLRSDRPAAPQCGRAFQQAADRFGERVDIEGEAVALGQVVFCAHVRRDIQTMTTAFGRIGELAAVGSRSGGQLSALGGALLAFATNDPTQSLTHLRSHSQMWADPALASLAKWIEAGALSQLGRPSLDAALKSQELRTGLPGTSDVVLWSLLREGRWTEAVAETKNRPKFDGDRDRFLWTAWCAAVHGALGDVEIAVEHLAEAESCRVDENQRGQLQLALVHCIIALARGDQQQNEDLVTDMLANYPIGEAASAMYLVAPRIVFDGTADGPAQLEALAVGPLHQRDLRLLTALADARAAGTNSPIRAIDWVDRPGELLTALQLEGAAEFLVRASAAGRPEAIPAIDWLFDIAGNRARVHIRAFCGHSESEVAKAATNIVASLPIRPEQRRRLGFLGTSALTIDGITIESAQWRRERVRSLLGFLVMHRTSTRDQVMAALWPDVDEVSARRNLRTTLNLVHKCLEPDRASGDAPYFVRSAGPTLTLVGDGALEVDVWSFAADLDQAAALEADGLPSTALPLLERAVDRYRGHLLQDVDDALWIDDARHPVRRRYLAACVRLAQLHLALGQAEKAETYARKAIATEPWSEPGHCALVAAHLELNDRAGAIRAASNCHQALAEVGGAAEPATIVMLTDLLAT